jgi:Flp pilus assembly protein TadD
MSGPPRDTGDPENGPTSRRLTPSIGSFEEPEQRTSNAPTSDVPSDASNEDFLFHLYRGSELLQDNRVHDAKEELERALHLQPRDTKGQDLLAVVYFRLGLYPRAIAIYEQLRRRNPRDTAILLNLALCYMKTGQPALARRDLEQLLQVNPTHNRAWGYLGLSCERLGDLEQAQRAFEQGGHHPMARRMAERRGSTSGAPAPPPREEESVPGREVREVVAAAFEELDAGELSFELAEPVSDKQADANEDWRSVELGAARSSKRAMTPPLPMSLGEAYVQSAEASARPDTKDGPPPAVIPQIGSPPSLGRRPTLIAPAAPAANHAEGVAVPLDRIPSPRPPAFPLEDPGTSPSFRRPVVAVPPVRTGTQTSLAHDAALAQISNRSRTLPPPSARPPTQPPPPAGQLTRESFVAFPGPGAVAIHPSGVALVRTAVAAGFSTRLEALRASSNGLSMRLLERHAKGKPTGESFGGASSPMVHAEGDGQLVLGARPGRKLSSFLLEDDMCFVREEVLLGFDGALAFENGRLATGEGEFVAVVQLRGKGAVLLEAIGEVLTLEVQANRGMSVRREVILGWFGRMVPRALAPSEAPCGQRGLVSFAGEGRVLVSGA